MSLNKTNSINLNEETKSLYSRINPINEMDLNSKIKLLNEVNEYVRSKNNCVKQVKITLSGEWQVVQIIKGDHRLSDIRPLVRFNVLVIVEKMAVPKEVLQGMVEGTLIVSLFLRKSGKKLQTKR